jgi:hypothetical protein
MSRMSSEDAMAPLGGEDRLIYGRRLRKGCVCAEHQQHEGRSNRPAGS